jgi:uncharacterized protein YoxC
MSETWAAVLAISVAVMALLQLALVIGLAIVWRRLVAVARTSQQQIERVATDVKLNLGAVTARVNAVADDVLGVTARMQQVATTVSDGVQRVEHSVKTAGQRVADTVDQVPASVKKGVPAGLAIIAALRTMWQVRSRLRQRREAHRYSRSDDPVDGFAS